MSKVNIIGWIISLGGTALWLYGYVATGNSSVIDWHTYTPGWVAEFLPNMEAEIGMALVFVSLVLTNWPPRRRVAAPVVASHDGVAVNSSDALDHGGNEAEQIPVVNVRDTVSEMIWKDPDMRRIYEALRSRGYSTDDAMAEIAKTHMKGDKFSASVFPTRSTKI